MAGRLDGMRLTPWIIWKKMIPRNDQILARSLCVPVISVFILLANAPTACSAPATRKMLARKSQRWAFLGAKELEQYLP